MVDPIADVVTTVTPDVVDDSDGTITMDTVNRAMTRVDCPNFSYLHEVAIWDEALHPEEMRAVSSHGEAECNLNNKVGGYQHSDKLQHWWIPGKDSSNIGNDYATNGTIDILEDSAGLSPSDIIPICP